MSILYLVLASTLFADLITKYLTVTLLYPFQSVPLLGTFLQFTYVQNRGAAFGILPGQQVFLIIVSILVCIFAVGFLYKEKPQGLYWQVGLALLLGGTLGNLYNRIFQGYVIDFIDFSFWPTFNVADIAINVGVALIIFQVVFLSEKKTRKKKSKRQRKK